MSGSRFRRHLPHTGMNRTAFCKGAHSAQPMALRAIGNIMHFIAFQLPDKLVAISRGIIWSSGFKRGTVPQPIHRRKSKFQPNS